MLLLLENSVDNMQEINPAREQAHATELGIRVLIITSYCDITASLHELANGHGEAAIYRGSMLSPEQYTQMWIELDSRGYNLINLPRHYRELYNYSDNMHTQGSVGSSGECTRIFICNREVIAISNDNANLENIAEAIHSVNVESNLYAIDMGYDVGGRPVVINVIDGGIAGLDKVITHDFYSMIMAINNY